MTSSLQLVPRHSRHAPLDALPPFPSLSSQPVGKLKCPKYVSTLLFASLHRRFKSVAERQNISMVAICRWLLTCWTDGLIQDLPLRAHAHADETSVIYQGEGSPTGRITVEMSRQMFSRIKRQSAQEQHSVAHILRRLIIWYIDVYLPYQAAVNPRYPRLRVVRSTN